MVIITSMTVTLKCFNYDDGDYDVSDPRWIRILFVVFRITFIRERIIENRNEDNVTGNIILVLW